MTFHGKIEGVLSAWWTHTLNTFLFLLAIACVLNVILFIVHIVDRAKKRKENPEREAPTSSRTRGREPPNTKP